MPELCQLLRPVRALFPAQGDDLSGRERGWGGAWAFLQSPPDDSAVQSRVEIQWSKHSFD